MMSSRHRPHSAGSSKHNHGTHRHRPHSAPADNIRKRLNKTNQYFSEKFGRAKPTPLEEDFLAMEKRVGMTEKLVDEVIISVEKFLYPNPAVRAKIRAASVVTRMLKRNRDARSAANLPEARIGDTMLARLDAFNPKDAGGSDNIRSSLEQYGNGFKTLADLRHAFEEHVTNNFIKPLGDTKKDIEEIRTLRSKLEGRRLDYDCRKRKKTNGDPHITEEEVRQAEERFEQTKKLTKEAMKNFIDRDVERVTALRALRDEMVEFHRQSINVLQKLGQDPLATNRSQSVNVSTTSTGKADAWGDDHYNKPKNVVIPSSEPPPMPASAPPQRLQEQSENPFTMYYRALYDCVPGSDEPASLSFKEGDIITFVEECDDKQWFYGSVDDRTGYVPYNYVQIIEEMPQA